MRPLTVTVPEVGVRTPVMIFRIVDFPEPFVPMMPTVSPCQTVMDTSFRASFSVYRCFFEPKASATRSRFFL